MDFYHPESGLRLSFPPNWRPLSRAEQTAAAEAQVFPDLTEAQRLEYLEAAGEPVFMLVPETEVSRGLTPTLRLDIHHRRVWEEFEQAELATLVSLSRFQSMLTLPGYEAKAPEQEVVLSGAKGIRYESEYLFHHTQSEEGRPTRLLVAWLEYGSYIALFNGLFPEPATQTAAFEALLERISFGE